MPCGGIRCLACSRITLMVERRENGEPYRVRTCDLLIKSQPLYALGLRDFSRFSLFYCCFRNCALRSVTLTFAYFHNFVSLSVSLKMPSKNLTCKIDQRSIDKYVKEQRLLGDRLTLSDEACGGHKLGLSITAGIKPEDVRADTEIQICKSRPTNDSFFEQINLVVHNT